MPGPVRLLTRFNGDVLSARRDGSRLSLDVRNWRPISFTTTTPAHADAVMALAGGGATTSELAGIARAGGDAAAADLALGHYMERLAYARLLCWSVADDEGELAHVEALAKRYAPKPDDPPQEPLRLCRFAFLRRVESEIVLESGLVRARIVLRGRGIELLAPLLPHQERAAPDSFAEALWRLGFLDTGTSQETGPSRYWEFHDLLMHEASRANREAVPVGGTYHLEGKAPPVPAVRQSPTGRRIELDGVDPGMVRQRSASLDAIQARRRSIRTYSGAAIGLAVLGEFLWRVCRTTDHRQDEREELVSRPYPASGSVNELEFYVAAERCEGLQPALYHYDSHGHALTELPTSRPAARKIVDACARTMGQAPGEPTPAVAIVISTRLPRLAWKYEGMAYRASLLNVGVVYHLMYMVAIDMGLAPCAIGTGDSRLLEEVAGLDGLAETAIGEFALGIPAVDRQDGPALQSQPQNAQISVITRGTKTGDRPLGTPG